MKNRLGLKLALVLLLIAALAAGMSVPLIWPDIANYPPKEKEGGSTEALPTLSRTQEAPGE